jgi:predicted heme/steroid binding protein
LFCSSFSQIFLHPLAVDGRWYDLASWAPHHPGGAEILRHFGGKDATDAFHSLHSPEAAARMAKMSSQPVLAHEVVAHVRPSKVALSFRELRDRLEREGWYERDLRHEFLYTAIILGLAFAGTWLAYSHAFVAMVLIGLSMQQANYLAHDWVHGRGAVCWWTGNLIGGIVCGYSRIWWSGTHNVHHGTFLRSLVVFTD